MLLSDFAAASVLISFGVVLGTTSPLQLIVMSLIEIVLFVVNEIIGRKYLGAIDAGDTIFVHAFGAYFGLAVSRYVYFPFCGSYRVDVFMVYKCRIFTTVCMTASCGFIYFTSLSELIGAILY